MADFRRRLTRLERGNGACLVCAGLPPAVVCLRDADDDWPYPACCPVCFRDLCTGVKVYIGISWDDV